MRTGLSPCDLNNLTHGLTVANTSVIRATKYSKTVEFEGQFDLMVKVKGTSFEFIYDVDDQNRVQI